MSGCRFANAFLYLDVDLLTPPCAQYLFIDLAPRSHGLKRLDVDLLTPSLLGYVGLWPGLGLAELGWPGPYLG